jgi:RNA polymerase sigma-70 factor, ECF subfamily
VPALILKRVLQAPAIRRGANAGCFRLEFRIYFSTSQIKLLTLHVYPIGMELRKALANIEEVGSSRRVTVENVAMRHLDQLYRFALHMTRDQDRAQELTQECVLRGLKNKSQIRKNPKAWLFRTLHNAFVSEYRCQRFRVSFEEEGKIRESETEFLRDPLPKFIAVQDVRTAIESLSEDLRAVIWLSDAEDFRLKEIAEVLELPLGTVASKLFRARQELRQLLSAYGPVQEKNL